MKSLAKPQAAPSARPGAWDDYPHEPDGMNRAEVARALGISRQSVIRAEHSAMRKLRQWCRTNQEELT